MGAISTEVAPKLGRLIRLLDSDNDGEALAAARALRRTLRSTGHDLHDLAATIEAGERVVERLVYRERPAPAAGIADPAAMILWCLANDDGGLSDKERRFVASLGATLACGGRASEKQAAWLRAIFSRQVSS